MTVKNLLGSSVLSLDFAATHRLLSGDYRIATTGLFLQTLAIENADSASYQLARSVVLELISGLRDGRAPSAEQVRHQVLRDAQFTGVHAVVNHQQKTREPCLRRVITMTGGELRALRSEEHTSELQSRLH